MTAKCVSNGKAMSVTVQDALERDSQAAFAESAAKLEALFNDVQDEDLDLDFEDDEDEEDSDFSDLADVSSEDSREIDSSPTVLHEEATALLERVKELLGEFEGKERTQLEKLMTSLRASLAGEDIDRLQNVIDEATDTLIDLEV